MAYLYRLILLFFLSVCFPAAVFAQSAPVGAIDLAGWIKGTDGTFSRAFADGAGTRATPTNTTVNSTSTALVQTSKGLQSFDIQKTATVDINRIGSAVGRFAKRVGPVAMALATAELICDLASICNQGGSWFTTQVQTLPPGDSSGWTCSHATSQAGTIDWCKANYYGCNSPTRLCSEDAVIDGGLGYKFKISERATGFVNGYADLHRPVAWVPAPTGATTATTDADWTSKETALNDSRFTPKLAEENEDVPTGVPTLTPDQKKQLGLDSVPTKDSSGNITGREDTTTEIEAVDAGTTDNPGRVIIKETKTTIKYDTNNTQISSTTNTSYTNQPQDKEPSQFTVSFDSVPEATLQTYSVPNTFASTSWGSGTCPPDINVSLTGGQHLTIPTQPVCDTAVMINPFTLLLASIISVYIVAGVRGGSAT